MTTPNNATSAQLQDIDTAKRALEGKGKKLEQLYSGFFGSEENCKLFTDCIPEYLYKLSSIVIVDAGSSQGVLGDYVRKIFEEKGCSVRLIMIDTNAVALNSSPVEAEKIEADLLEIPLPDNFVDLVILRSVLQYVEPVEQNKILKSLHKKLKQGGVLVSQFVSLASDERADLVNKIFSFAGRSTNFCSRDGGVNLHKNVFGDDINVTDGPILSESFDEFFIDRVSASDEQILEAKEFIYKNVGEFGDFLVSKEEPYSWKFPYTFVSCKKG